MSDFINFRVTPIIGWAERMSDEAFQNYLDRLVDEYPGTVYEKDPDGANVSIPRTSMALPKDVQTEEV